MTYLFVEKWSCRKAWLDLPVDQRKDFVAKITVALQLVTERGIKNLGWGEVDKTVDRPTQHQFWAIWEIQSIEAVASFMQGVRESGWYEYFDQENIVGSVQSADQVLQSMLAN